ncbi:hypothetical protein [Limnovirga soli]|jgi:hypothetical protein|uniref:Uncharacterized protein n=1 Tax=Limnovirga soli TaxID=2656915 RepID=A0A8J8FGP3_9BACT|nr:hypothetical protein [Limnovirga soli]NNV57735.1 hypothetical protein [Limnovirga soli]
MPVVRTETNATYALQYNNGTPIPLKDFSGLHTKSITEVDSTDGVFKKNRIQALEFNEVTLTLSMPLQEPARQLFDGVMKGNLTTVFTTIFRLEANSKLVQSFELGNCKIKQISFPSLDATSKNAGNATITFQPAHIDMTLGNNSRIAISAPKNETRFIASNFRLAIDNVPTSRISKISALTVCPHTVENISATDILDFIEFKSLQIQIAEAEMEDEGWQKWLTDFVKVQQKEGRNGSLQFLGPDLKKVILEISLTNIFIASTGFHEDGAENQIAKASIELLFDFATMAGNTTPADTKFIRSGVVVKPPVLNIPDTKTPDVKPGK